MKLDEYRQDAFLLRPIARVYLDFASAFGNFRLSAIVNKYTANSLDSIITKTFES